MEQKDIQELQELVRQQAIPLQLVKTEMGRIIAGQEKLVDRLLLALISDWPRRWRSKRWRRA